MSLACSSSSSLGQSSSSGGAAAAGVAVGFEAGGSFGQLAKAFLGTLQVDNLVVVVNLSLSFALVHYFSKAPSIPIAVLFVDPPPPLPYFLIFYHNFKITITYFKERLSSDGEELVQQLMAMEVVNRQGILDAFDQLAGLVEQGSEAQHSVYQFRRDVGLCCLCIPDENTREIGIELLKVVRDW